MKIVGKRSVGRIVAVRHGLGAQSCIVTTFFMSLSPLLPHMAAALGHSIARTGLVATVYTAAFAVSTLVTALRSDSIPAARLLLIAGIGHGLGILCAAMAGSLPQLVAGFLVAAVAAGILQPTAYRAAMELAPADARGKWLGTLTAGWSMAVIAGAPLLAWSAPVIGWRVPLALVALSWLPVLLALRSLKKPRPTDRSPERKPIPSTPILLAYLATVIAGAGFHGTFQFTGAALVEGGADQSTGLVFLAFGLGAFSASLALGRIPQISPERGFQVCMLSACPVYLSLPVAFDGAASGAAAMFLWGFLQILAFAQLVLVVAQGSAGRFGLAMGLSAASMMAGAAIGTGFGLIIYGSAGFTYLCLFGAILALLSAVPFAGSRRGYLAHNMRSSDRSAISARHSK